MPYVYLIVIMHGMVEEILRYPREATSAAEHEFVNQMERRISNFDEYSVTDIDACLEDGFEGFGGGDCSIQLHWADN